MPRPTTQTSPFTAETPESAVLHRQAELAALLGRLAPRDGIEGTPIEALSLIRASQPTDPLHAVHKSALCIVAQGRKQVMLGEEVYLYDAAHYLVVTVDLPIVGQVIQASKEHPYLCLRLDLEPAEVGSLLLSPGLPAPKAAPGGPREERGMFLDRTTLPLIEAALRLVRLLETPQDIPVLAPLVVREIVYRLLQSPHGERLRRSALAGGQAHRIARAIGWVKLNYAQPLRIEAMAREVGLSASALHHQFKAVTAMSPLQYQKQLRLQEARRLLLGEVTDAATAGYRVGYESSSQFSREYSRLFGAPPSRDVARLRGLMGAGRGSGVGRCRGVEALLVVVAFLIGAQRWCCYEPAASLVSMDSSHDIRQHRTQARVHFQWHFNHRESTRRTNTYLDDFIRATRTNQVTQRSRRISSMSSYLHS